MIYARASRFARAVTNLKKTKKTRSRLKKENDRVMVVVDAIRHKGYFSSFSTLRFFAEKLILTSRQNLTELNNTRGVISDTVGSEIH